MCIYAITKAKHRSKILILGSAYFIWTFSPFGLINVAVSALTAYMGGILIYNYREVKKVKKGILIGCVVLNVIMFLGFAYSNYNPLDVFSGLTCGTTQYRLYTSFGVCVYTLHSISYCVDIYRAEYKPETKFSVVCAYVGFMPSLTRGPILNFGDIKDTLVEPAIKSEMLSDGIVMFLWGLAEKVILANQLSVFWHELTAVGIKNMSIILVWIAMFVFAFWFYYEFQSFSHMARGFSLMLGFEIQKDFEFPFAKKSVREVVKSLNISVYKWVDRYVYRSLGGGERKNIVTFRNVFVCALIMSAWYGFGLNFMLYGAFLAVIICIEMLLEKWIDRAIKPIRILFTNLVMLIAMALFAGKDFGQGFLFVRRMFSSGTGVGVGLSGYFIKSTAFLIIVCIILATPLVEYLRKKFDNTKMGMYTVLKPVIILALLIFCTAYMSAETTVSYFQF